MDFFVQVICTVFVWGIHFAVWGLLFTLLGNSVGTSEKDPTVLISAGLAIMSTGLHLYGNELKPIVTTGVYWFVLYAFHFGAWMVLINEVLLRKSSRESGWLPPCLALITTVININYIGPLK